MNDPVVFKHGLAENIPEDITAGQVLVAKDTGEIFVDVDESTRVEIGKNKQDKLTPDRSITIKDGVISVTYPVVPITQAEYDNLSEAEKNADILYVVKDAEPDGIQIDETPAEGSNNAVSSNGVYQALQQLTESVQNNVPRWGVI